VRTEKYRHVPEILQSITADAEYLLPLMNDHAVSPLIYQETLTKFKNNNALFKRITGMTALEYGESGLTVQDLINREKQNGK
jgi:hypothetical protein